MTAHSQVLSGLEAGKLYHYQVKSRDAAGNLTVSGDFTFTTAQNGSGGIKWLVTDHLGSTRMVIDETGSLAGIKRHDFLPFGEELFAGVGIRSASLGYGADSVRQKFTSKERDAETGLDYFLARYYSSTQGRFTSPDEFTGGPDELFIFADAASANPTFYADLTNPQSLNKYQYTYNNPLSYIDPDGHCPVCPAYYYEYYVKPTIQQVDSKITQIKNDLVDYGKGMGKSVANAVIDMSNAGAKITGDEPHARYEPSNEVQAMAMNSGDKLMILSGGAGKGLPANVAMAEGKNAAIVGAGANKLSPKVQSIMNEIDKQGIKVTVNPKKPETAQEGNVTLHSGKTQVNLRVETHPLKPGGPPVRHANVEVTQRIKNKNKVIENRHIDQ
jgi:RHS repeat-associated protein